MSDSRWKNLLIVLRKALIAPAPILTLAAGLLLAAALHGSVGLIVFLATIGVVAVFTVVKLLDAEFVRSAVRSAREHDVESDEMNMTFRVEELDVDSRLKMKSIMKLQRQIARDVASSTVSEVATELADTVRQAHELVERGLLLSQKRRELMHYINMTDPSAIEARIAALKADLDRESDQDRKSELEISLAAKEQELADYQAINHAASRVLDQLDNIECSFSGLRAKIVRIKSTDIAEWTSAHEELKIELGSLSRSADVVEESINEALNIRS